MKAFTHSTKSSLLSVFTAAFVCGLSSNAYTANVVHWRLDEASGTIASDSSGNGIDGAWQGTAGDPGWQPAGGVAGGAFSFTGANLDSFIAEPAAGFGDLPFTISLWMNSTFSANGGLAYLGDGSTGNSYYVVRSQSAVAKANGRNTSEVQNQGTTLINDGEWHHLVGVYSSTADRKIYVDGVLEGSSTVDVPALPLTRFGIGALTRRTPYNPADLYSGLLDDVQLYDTALTDSEIMFLHNNPGSVVPEPSSLILTLLSVLGFGVFTRRMRRK